MRRLLRTALALLPLVGCAGPDGGPERAEWRARVDTVGDTTVVRTLAGSEWGAADLVAELRIGAVEGAHHEIFGEVTGLAVDGAGQIYIYDRQVPALRKYGADDRYLATLGGRGGGPGEYENSDGGLVTLRDGRVVLRDPGNGRFAVYGPDGDHLESWPARGGTFTSVPIFAAADGGFYNPVFGGGEPMRLVRHAPDGTPGDSLPLPDRAVETPTVSARRDGSSQTWYVPFTARALWTFHPAGYNVSAVSDRFAIDLLRPDGTVLRIEKEAEMVPVLPAERAAEEARVTEAMRRLDPSWRWNGPPIPETKPPLRSLFAGREGRIWVLLHRRGGAVPEKELEPEPSGRPPPPRFREPAVFEVFEPDGRYLGRVHAPSGFSTSPLPIFGDRHVWATERDELGVQYVVRYRISMERASRSPAAPVEDRNGRAVPDPER